MADFECPSCLSSDVAPFFEVRGVPVHDVLLMQTREEAIAHARGDVALGFCRACGFIANTLYDPALLEYGARCEETQGFSPTFRSWLDALVERLIDDYDIRGRKVVEIGCGKGEFLAAVCERGDNRGVGIDPAYVPDRLPAAALERTEFLREAWGERHFALEADVICCRHTLEHIAPVRSFLDSLRRSLATRDNTLLFFEVPDTLRVLREGAFWDVYYEHCSYFTAGSLARLFRAAGFELLELWRDYADQYLLLTARPGASGPSLPLEDDLAEVASAVGRFRAVFDAQRRVWPARVEDVLRGGGRVVIWGSGSKAVAFLTTLALGDRIEYVVDINPHKQGRFMPGTGQRVVAPRFLESYRPDAIIVMNPVYHDEIRRDLDAMHLGAELLPL